MSERNPDELGALWVKTSPKGEYMTGTIGEQRVVCFRLEKRTERSPDWRILKARPREDAPNQEAPRPITHEDVPFAWLLPLVLPALAILG